MIKGLVYSFLIFGGLSAKEANKDNLIIKYKKGKNIDFDALLIEGQKRAEKISLIGGDTGEKDYKLLKNLKQSFKQEQELDLIGD